MIASSGRDRPQSRGSGLISQVPAGGPAESPDGQAQWPVRSGVVPPLADGFSTRPESAPRVGAALVPGHRGRAGARPRRRRPGSRDWLGSCGKTQLAVFFAESLWRSREVDLLVWVPATSRASVLAGYAEAAEAALGTDPSGDAEADRRALRELARRDPAALAGGARRPDRRGRSDRAVAGRAGGPGPDHRDQPGRPARRAPGPGPPGRGVQLPGGAELPDGPPDRRPGPAARRDRPRRGPRLRAHGARPGQRRHRHLLAVLPGLPGLLHGPAGPAGRRPRAASRPPPRSAGCSPSSRPTAWPRAGRPSRCWPWPRCWTATGCPPPCSARPPPARTSPRTAPARPAAREQAWSTLPVLERTGAAGPRPVGVTRRWSG